MHNPTSFEIPHSLRNTSHELSVNIKPAELDFYFLSFVFRLLSTAFSQTHGVRTNLQGAGDGASSFQQTITEISLV